MNVRARWLLPVLLLAACHARPRQTIASKADDAPKADEPRLVELDLSAGAPESTDGGALFRSSAAQTYTGLVRTISRVASDDKVRGLFVRLGGVSFNLAESEELSRLLAKLRGHKPVVCHAHTLNNSTALLSARGCSKVWLSPAGDVSTIGIAAQMVYLHGIFRKLKVDVDFLHVGKFKSGAEPLTREGPSEEARASLVETLAAIRGAWLEESNEVKKSEALRDALEHGPWSAGEALERGLIDEIGFDDQALEAAKKAAKVNAVEVSFGPRAKSGGGPGIGDLLRVLSGASGDSTGKPHIAVVPAEGAITMEAGGPLQRGGITARALNKTLRRMQKDDSVKAVVLRIDSPGGSPLASDLIWHELMELRKKKPILVSVGNMAASGGYYIACASSRIFAERTSIVGSIGVFGGKINVAPALDQFGIHAETFAASPDPGAAERASFNSPLSSWDDATRERVRAQMQGIYDLFIARVAHGRQMDPEKVRASAEGHIWSGDQGRERGLVDEIGGLSEALAAARKAAHLDADAPVSVEGGREGLLDSLLLGDDASDADANAAFERLSAAPTTRLLSEVPAELRMFVSGFAPLSEREHVVLALPYGLLIH
jgi:protease-4